MTPESLLDLAVETAEAAGRFAREGRRGGLTGVSTKTTPTDMVTHYDGACESMIAERILAARPTDGILGEEGTSRAGSSGITWIVDPIDGTTNFLYDLPTWAVSIAAADAEGPLVGVVVAPALGETFTAVRGVGAWRNGEPIACSTATDLAVALVATGFGYAASDRVRQARRVRSMIGELRDIRRFGAAAVDLCFVACGRLDAYFEEGLHPWDVAAGGLIAAEAGCLLSDFSGGPLRPAETLAAAPGIADALRRLIARASEHLGA
jgi:myo-inositol-1(or 4)-monophosphatase